MNPLEQHVAEWLRRDGRVPDDALAQLPSELADGIGDRSELERIAERIAASQPELAARRRVVLGIQARMQARGGVLSLREREDLARRARDAGWSDDDVDRVIEAALMRMQSASRTPDSPPHGPESEVSNRHDAPARSNAARIRTPVLVAVIGLLGVAVIGGGYWMTRGGEDPPAAEVTDTANSEPMAPEQVRAAQRLLSLLGQPVPETGQFDEQTRAALDRALPQYAGIDQLEPWLVDQLQAALDNADDEAWAAAAESDTLGAINAYLERFAEGRHADTARNRLEELGAAEERSGIIRGIQQELNRLGRRVEETGVLDPATRSALDGFPGPIPDQTRASLAAARQTLREMLRWPVSNGDTFRDCATCPEMIAIPSGRFVMGSPSEERMRSPNEGPQREVSVPRFALSITEVTHGQWLACVNEGVCSSLPVPSEGDLRRLPVTHVSWTDALDYLRWLRERTGFDYRLPSEAEWEYAARAGTTTRYHTGDCISDEQANFDARLPSGDCARGGFQGSVMPVASFAPNAFGLYDMHGNVTEPTRDCWNSDYTDAPTIGIAWESGDCGRAPHRGGSWNSSDREIRSAARLRPTGALRDPDAGLRIAVSLLPER